MEAGQAVKRQDETRREEYTSEDHKTVHTRQEQTTEREIAG
jgi:hypothetical protein